MSNNINDTQINKIKIDCQNMIKDIENDKDLNYSNLEKKYEYLFKTSKTLYNFIVKEHTKNSFNKEDFNKKLNQMLSLIKQIQDQEISKYDASVNIGEKIAKEYIPAKFLGEN